MAEVYSRLDHFYASLDKTKLNKRDLIELEFLLRKALPSIAGMEYFLSGYYASDPNQFRLWTEPALKDANIFQAITNNFYVPYISLEKLRRDYEFTAQ